MGMDISPDGNTLIVADSTASSTNNWVHVIDLTSGQSRKVFFPLAFGESGTFAVAFGGDGAALISSRFSGSGWVPLRRYDPASGQVTTVSGSVRQDSMVSASGDGSTIVIAESNSSGGPFSRYDVGMKAITRSGGTSWFNYECAANKDGSILALPTYGSTFIYDGSLNRITNIGVYAGAQPSAAAFHPSADAVFCPFVSTPYVRVYETTTWQMVAQFDFQTTFSNPGNHAFVNGRTRLSPDGKIVFVTVTGGVQYLRHNLNLPVTHRLIVSGNPGPLGTPTSVPYGTSWLPDGSALTIEVPNLVETNGTRYAAAGWSGNGSVPLTGAGTSVSFTLLTNSLLTWNWSTNQYQFMASISGQGTVNITDDWYAPGATVNLMATPNSGYKFVRWLGSVPVCDATNSQLSVIMDQPRTLVALFAPVGGSATSLAGDWATFGNGPAHSGYFPGGLGNASFSTRWVTNIAGISEALQQVAVGGGKIFVTPIQYFATSYLAALNEADGHPLWKYDFVSAYAINPPTYDSGNVYVQRSDSSSTALWSFDATTGVTNWVTRHGAQFENYFAPTVAAGHVWVNGGTYGGMYGFNQATGAQLFYQSFGAI